MTLRRNNDKITINDIAKMAGVSKKTVSRVINNAPAVRESTRKQIQEIIKETGFVPNPQAQALAFKRSFLIGLIYDNPSPQYIVNMQRGVLETLRDTHFQLVLRPCDRSDPDYQEKILSFVQLHNPFGMIFLPSVSEDESLSTKLEEMKCHFVRVASVDVADGKHQVKTGDAEGARLAARHLAQLGHKRIGHIRGPKLFMSSHERLNGFRSGLEDFGLSLSDDLIKEGAYTFDSGLACATALLHLKERPTAIFAGNDEMAVGVYFAARKAGLKIPEDLSVVGYDDTPMVGRVWPPMTSVRSPIREVGRQAARLLLQSDKSEAFDMPETIELELIVRESTSAPRLP